MRAGFDTDRLNWLRADYDDAPARFEMPEKELWAEVLKRAIWDYLKPSEWLEEKDRLSAIAFFADEPTARKKVGSLRFICDAISENPDALRKMILAFVRSERKLGNRRPNRKSKAVQK